MFSSPGQFIVIVFGPFASSDGLDRFFNANPKSSKWFNRDRFVLSNGYVSVCVSRCE
jgi:hypothetical protein